MALTHSAGSGIGLWRALPRAGRRPLHLGAGGFGASQRGISAGPSAVRRLDVATWRGCRPRCAIGVASIRAALCRLPRPGRTWERSGCTVDVSTSSRFLSGNFKYKSTAAGEPPTDEDLVADDSRRPACQRDALLCRATLDRGIKRRRGAGKVVFRSIFRARPPHRNPRCDPNLAGKCGPRKDAVCRPRLRGCHGDAGRGGQRFDDESGHAVFARDLTAPWTFPRRQSATGHLVAPDNRYHAGAHARLCGRAVCRCPLGPGELRRLARPHATLGKGWQLRRCGIRCRPKPARQLPYQLGDVRPLPYA